MVPYRQDPDGGGASSVAWALSSRWTENQPGGRSTEDPRRDSGPSIWQWQWQWQSIHLAEAPSILVRLPHCRPRSSLGAASLGRANCESSSRPRQSRSRPSATPVKWCAFVGLSGDPRSCVGSPVCLVTRTSASLFALTIKNAASYAETNSASSLQRRSNSKCPAQPSRLSYGAITPPLYHCDPLPLPHPRLLWLGVWGKIRPKWREGAQASVDLPNALLAATTGVHSSRPLLFAAQGKGRRTGQPPPALRPSPTEPFRPRIHPTALKPKLRRPTLPPSAPFRYTRTKQNLCHSVRSHRADRFVL